MKKLILPEIKLAPTDTDKWEGKIKGFLWNIRNLELSYLSLRKESDGSSSINTLSRCNVVRSIFPCPVNLYDLPDEYILEIQTGYGKYSFNKISANKEFLIELQLDEKWNSMFDYNKSSAFIRLKKGKEHELSYASSMLESAVEFFQEKEQYRLLKIREETLIKIGYHPIELKEATGESDIRIPIVTRMKGGQKYKLTPIDLVNDMLRTSRLVKMCPDSINQVMHRSRMLYVHGYSQWEFLTMSVHYAVLALELSLRELYDAWLGSEPIKVEGNSQGEKFEELLTPSRDSILKWSNKYDVKNVKVKGLQFPRNKPQLLDHAVRIGVMSQWEKKESEHLLWLRDAFSHPSSTFTQWISWVIDRISDACLFINLMWSRFMIDLPTEFSWDQYS
jgi:hypothetical protein